MKLGELNMTDVEKLRWRRALEAAGFEPPENVCQACKHRGGDHDMHNWCLLCPRPAYVSGPRYFQDRINVGWCYFSSMTEGQKWEHGIAQLDFAPWEPADAGVADPLT